MIEILGGFIYGLQPPFNWYNGSANDLVSWSITKGFTAVNTFLFVGLSSSVTGFAENTGNVIQVKRNNVVTQIQIVNGNIYIRYYDGTAWGAWKKIQAT